MKKVLSLVLLLCFIFMLAACGSEEGEAAETKNDKEASPEKIVMGFVPSQDSDKIADTVKPLADKLSEELGVPVEGKVMNSYSAVVEGMGSGQIQIGFLPAFAYVLAEEKYGVKVALKSERYGSDKYRAQYVVRKDSGINSLEDLEGKIWAIPDVTSTSGFLFPANELMEKFDVKDVQQDFFSQTISAGGHDNAVVALLDGNADVATTFEDAREDLVKEYPNVMEDTKILGYTKWIPNDTISLIPDLSDDMKEKITKAFLSFNDDDEMIKVMNDVYSWDAIVEAKDEDYQIVRDTYKKFKDTINIDDM
ncbi:phosphate/phosphite/phosphonate ABC transporter substrate-binding protein [Halobacillus salinarum]|uniref:Phosphate/phosphite/phosphonate ABC transporter substrate-binding protein n=1 Tax=Halobacillus salinarum TaxID=2932257 RepID=A0ABY4EG67_9BACI|nr:phosphate/phosphite/phosphonate ABC transporter substrate-binding protein [Halobacillus salinarum]UOQ43455.1 phosphate/phosphite/phosphonate ABC transporter substrate-binding protein [Halobacillus salinarum]